MQLPEFKAGEFLEFVATKQYKKALQNVMGVGDKPVIYARALIKCLEELSPVDRQNLLEWCEVPMELQPVEELHWYVEQIARHEVGHAVVAKLLGFETGSISIMLTAANGDHVAATEMLLDSHASNLNELERYLERRIIVLMAGAMSEPESVQDLKHSFGEAFKVAESDRQKSDELIQVLLNMRGKKEPSNLARCRSHLFESTYRIVYHNHTVIDSIAKKLAGQIENYKQMVTWPAEKFHALPEIANLVNPLHGYQ